MSSDAMLLRRDSARNRVVRGATALLMMTAMAACDTEVTNPGPFEDRFLDDPQAHAAVVNGAIRSLGQALSNVAYTTASITRELFPAGSTSSFGITPRQQQGILAFDDEHQNPPWTAAQRARFIAESGFERFAAERQAAGQSIDNYLIGGRAALWAAYANRLLGENWCQVTFEGGPPVPADSALKRAETWFTRALAIGQQVNNAELVNAAIAGRASVRVGLGNWAGAVADANRIQTAFRFQMPYSSLETDQYNRIFWAGASTPYRAHTVWRTLYQQYYEQTRDPRVPWARHPTQETGDAAVMDLGRVPFLQQQKYKVREAPINLSSGREMRLIEAEAMLREGNWEGAMAIINELRASVGVQPWPASSLEEAWTRLKRERGIELWIEGRRMFDLRRWAAASTPGALDPLEVPGEASRLAANRSLCYDIPKSERETNPNVPLTP
ncbi:MAG TPA: RagB/SusD family nutrient uptake outer membrane protein [Longimicrobiaceae bacterium]|nr:RagB/SusD family nutrient uptake outer membrane protein [Longimicrobiaceae bacterium]